MELTINQKFRDLIPALTADELNLLTENIKKDGVREPILIWRNTIIDGHNRYAICRENNIPFETKEIEFYDDNEALLFIIKNQLGRRNLTDFNRANLALQLESIFKEKAKENQKQASFITNILRSSQDGVDTAGTHKLLSPAVFSNLREASINTEKEIAKIAGLSQDTIKKVKKINNNAIDDVKYELSRQDSKISINTAAIISELSENKQKEILQLDKKDIIKKAQKIKAKEKPNTDFKASFGDAWQTAGNIEIICYDNGGSQAKERITDIINNNGSFVLIADKTKQKSDVLINLSNIILEKLKKIKEIRQYQMPA